MVHVPERKQARVAGHTQHIARFRLESSMQSSVAVAALKSFIGARAFRRNEDGQDLLEYGLLMALIAIIALGAVAQVGNVINTIFWTTIASSF
jgi:Flp pilus assembly pilin Flp